MEIKFYFIPIFVLTALPSCRVEEAPINLRLQNRGGYLEAVIRNNSVNPIDVMGAAGPGIPPAEKTIQWQVLVNDAAAFPCVMSDSEFRRTTVVSGSSAEFKIKVSDIEGLYCLRSQRLVPYEVAAYYVGPSRSYYSNRVKLVARP